VQKRPGLAKSMKLCIHQKSSFKQEVIVLFAGNNTRVSRTVSEISRKALHVVILVI